MELLVELVPGTTSRVQIASTGLLPGALLLERKPLWLVSWAGPMDLWLGLARERTNPVQPALKAQVLQTLDSEPPVCAVSWFRRGAAGDAP